MSGKDGGWILPVNIDPTRVCVRLNVPNDPDHLAAFWGALWTLTYWNAWQRDPLQRGRQVAAVWKDVWFEAKAINDHLEACEAMYFDVRQDPLNPCTLEKTDDGVNWVSFANLRLCRPSLRVVAGAIVYVDPITGDITPIDVDETFDGRTDAPPPAPRSGTATANKCLAAANAVVVLVATHQETVRLLQGGVIPLVAAAGIVSLLALLIFFPPSVIFVASVIGQAVAILGALSENSFTEEIQDELKCILFNNATDSAGVVTFDYDAVMSEIQANAGIGDMWRALDFYGQIVGPAGLNRAGGTTSVTTANCDECSDEWCYTFDFTQGQGGWTAIEYPGNYLAGAGWGSSNWTQVGNRGLTVRRTFIASNITSVDMEWTGSPGSTQQNAIIWVFNGGTQQVRVDKNAWGSSWSWSGSVTGTEIRLSILASNQFVYNGNAVLTRCTIRGTGTNPFGEDNCE